MQPATLLKPDHVVNADPGELGDLLAPQPWRPAGPHPGRQPDLGRLKALTP